MFRCKLKLPSKFGFIKLNPVYLSRHNPPTHLRSLLGYLNSTFMEIYTIFKGDEIYYSHVPEQIC